MPESTDRVLGRIEGKLDGLQDDARELKRDSRKNRGEVQALRESVGRVLDKFDETGQLKPQYAPRPLPESQVVVESKARTGMWHSFTKLAMTLAGLGGAAWAWVVGTK
ncbi:MAG: hypothetical protein ACRBN8_22380 [Nannocystales bacterium]